MTTMKSLTIMIVIWGIATICLGLLIDYYLPSYYENIPPTADVADAMIGGILLTFCSRLLIVGGLISVIVGLVLSLENRTELP